jgi:hypothetical protein
MARLIRDESRRTSTASTMSDMDVNYFTSHRDTLARTQPLRRTQLSASAAVVREVLHHLSFQDYLNLRFVCREWFQTLPSPWIPPIRRLPREILQLIFSYQEPCDFEAARHACRAWFTAGMDLSILCPMLTSMQCQHA